MSGSLVTVACVVIGSFVFNMVRESRTREFLDRYTNLGRLMAGTFYEMEVLADAAGQNALGVLHEIEVTRGLPDDATLAQLAESLNVMAFYAQDKNGRFTRSSDLPIEQQVNSLFDYSQDYRKLLTGEVAVQRTPVIPGWPNRVPAKFTMVPNHDRSGILEVGYNLEYLGRMLREIIGNDPHILSVGLFAPNGYQLGKIDRHGNYAYGVPDAMPDTGTGHRWDTDSAQFNIKVPSPVKTCPECTVKGTQLHNEPYHYVLSLSVSDAPLMGDIAKAWQTIALVVAATIILGLLMAWFIANSLVRGLRDITATAGDIVASGNLSLRVACHGRGDEVYSLSQTFNRMLATLADSQGKLVEAERLRSIAKLASEVAHDIRSPIAALEAVSKQSTAYSQEERHLVLEATKRIRDIANNLLTQHRRVTDAGRAHKTAELVVSILQSAVSQKRSEFAHRDVEIDIDADDSASEVFVDVCLADFKRTLSNLLTNAVESTSRAGKVCLSVGRREQRVMIQIRDNGCGMSSTQMEKAQAGGYTSKGDAGNGIGLSSSIARIASWDGTLTLESKPLAGTCVNINLPVTEQAPWFAARVEIDPNLTTVVIDDEGFIGTLWKQRLLSTNPDMDEARIRFFRRSNDFLAYFRNHGDTIGTCLVDYEFVDSAMTGVELIDALGIAARSYLVTSHDEEPEVRRQCVAMGLRMVPKTLVHHIDIVGTELVERIGAYAEVATRGAKHAG